MTRAAKSVLAIPLFLVQPLVLQAQARANTQGGRKPRSATERFYIATRATLITDQMVSVFGATNLPPGSVLIVFVYDHLGMGGTDHSDQTNAVVDEDGLFRVGVRSRENFRFATNMICGVVFQPNNPPQPEKVIKVVGAFGQHLGSPGTLPQVEGNSRITELVDYTVVRE